MYQLLQGCAEPDVCLLGSGVLAVPPELGNQKGDAEAFHKQAAWGSVRPGGQVVWLGIGAMCPFFQPLKTGHW